MSAHGQPLHRKFDPELGIHSNWHEALSQLRKIVNYCNKHDVDFLVLNGDIFHTGRPTPEAVVRVRRELDRLDATKVIAEPGNHDLQQINASHADPLTTYFAGSRWCETVVTEPSVIDIDGFMLAVMPSVCPVVLRSMMSAKRWLMRPSGWLTRLPLMTDPAFSWDT